jgi:type II secretory pathway component PulK
MDPPYYAKNGPVDDIRELLLIKGMTEQIFWGTTRVGQKDERRDKSGRPPPLRRPMTPYLQSIAPQVSGVGLIDLFVPFHGSGQAVNVNTASSEVLQLVPGVDSALANAIVSARNGPDGQPGTDDDTPFLNPGEALMAAGADPLAAGAMRQLFIVQSRVFEVTVDAEIGSYKRRFTAMVDRRGPRDVTTLYFTWK